VSAVPAGAVITTRMYPDAGTVPAEEEREIEAYAAVIVAEEPLIIVD